MVMTTSLGRICSVCYPSYWYWKAPSGKFEVSWWSSATLQGIWSVVLASPVPLCEVRVPGSAASIFCGGDVSSRFSSWFCTHLVCVRVEVECRDWCCGGLLKLGGTPPVAKMSAMQAVGVSRRLHENSLVSWASCLGYQAPKSSGVPFTLFCRH